MPDDDPLLAITLDDDEGLDVDTRFLFPKGLDDDFDGVGDLLLIVEEDLLTDDLGDEETGRLVGEGVLLEVGWRERDEALDTLLQGLYIEVVQRRERYDLRQRSTSASSSACVVRSTLFIRSKTGHLTPRTRSRKNSFLSAVSTVSVT